MAKIKTNAMRLLDGKGIEYTAHEYVHGDEAVDGVTVAEILGQNPAQVFKTLVAKASNKAVYVFVVPVAMKLDYKKAASACGEKSVCMVPVAEINSLTGYVRGGCSPIGMKKNYPVFYHYSLTEHNTVMVSAGKIGYQIEISPENLIEITAGKLADIASED